MKKKSLCGANFSSRCTPASRTIRLTLAGEENLCSHKVETEARQATYEGGGAAKEGRGHGEWHFNTEFMFIHVTRG